MIPQIGFYVLACLFGGLVPLLLDAYGFRKEALELTECLACVLIGIGIAKVFL